MRTKQNYILMTLFVLLLGFMNLQIFQKEQIKQDGETFYFQLRPVDPRAFMLGDYMELNFQHNLHNNSEQSMQTFVVTFDDKNIAIDAKPYNNEALMDNQRLFNIQDKLRPDRFYFQEGHSKAYEQSQYGLFRYLSPDQFLLDSLVDTNLQPIDLKSLNK